MMAHRSQSGSAGFRGFNDLAIVNTAMELVQQR